MTEYYAGQDLGKRRDYSALAVLERTYDDKLRLVALKEWPHVDYKIVVADTKQIYKKFGWYKLGVDQSGIGDSIVEEYHYENAQGIVFTAKAKEEMIEYMILLRQQGKLILPRNGATELIRQLEEQERILSDAGNVTYRHPSGRHDDLLWALALACHVAKEGLEKSEPLLMTFSADDYYPQDRNQEILSRVLGKFVGSGITVTGVKVRIPGDDYLF